MKKPTLTLLDDGTLDTVFQCDLCGETLRYADISRDEYGDIEEREREAIEEDHADECEEYDDEREEPEPDDVPTWYDNA